MCSTAASGLLPPSQIMTPPLPPSHCYSSQTSPPLFLTHPHQYIAAHCKPQFIHGIHLASTTLVGYLDILPFNLWCVGVPKYAYSNMQEYILKYFQRCIKQIYLPKYKCKDDCKQTHICKYVFAKAISANIYLRECVIVGRRRPTMGWLYQQICICKSYISKYIFA